MNPVAASLLDREDSIRGLLAEALKAQGRRRTEFTFNVTNVLIDFETQTATVDDELDPTVSVEVSLEELRQYTG